MIKIPFSLHHQMVYLRDATKMKLQPRMLFLTIFMMFIVFRMTKFQYQHTEMESISQPFDSVMESEESGEIASRIGYLPSGIVQSNSDLELKPLWVRGTSGSKDVGQNNRTLLAIAVGIEQKKSVDSIVTKFISENFTVILFHYDGNVNDWQDCSWSSAAIHITAHSQTKWWFAKRFLHPDVVSIYDYIFLWDEDLGIENFHPGRYLDVVKSEGLEISQPALDPNLSEIHHQITVRRKKAKVHRRVWDRHGGKCSHDSKEPPCTGWVEGMAPVFSRSAWRCVWNLIQNDLIHGWGLDMKLGYCAQGDPTKKVGVVDSEYIVHQGVQTLGGPSTKKQRGGTPVMDSRTEPSAHHHLFKPSGQLDCRSGCWTIGTVLNKLNYLSDRSKWQKQNRRSIQSKTEKAAPPPELQSSAPPPLCLSGLGVLFSPLLLTMNCLIFSFRSSS